MSARSWASALRRSPAARCRISISWARKNSSSCATSSSPNTARASPRRNCWSTWPPRARPFTAASRRRSRPRRKTLQPGWSEAQSGMAEAACPKVPDFAALQPGYALVEDSRRLHQAFLGERFLHLGARGDAGLVGHQVVQAGEGHLVAVGPAQHGKEIAVCHRELLAHQIVAAGKLAVDIFELAHRAVLEEGLGVVGEHRREHRAHILVQFGGDVVEPLEQFVALGAVAGGREVL